MNGESQSSTHRGSTQHAAGVIRPSRHARQCAWARAGRALLALLAAGQATASCKPCERELGFGPRLITWVLPNAECPPGFFEASTARTHRLAAAQADAKVSLVAMRNDDGLRSKFVSVQARPKRTDADYVAALPFILGPGFDVSVTTGIFRSKLSGPVEGGLFGLEVLGADPATESYAIYAALASNPDGIILTVVTADGIVGSERRFDGIDRVGVRIQETDGTVYFQYRTASFWSHLANVPRTGAGPFQAATAVYDIDSKGEVGFTNLDVASLGTVVGKRAGATPKAIASDGLTEGMRNLMRALTTLNLYAPSTGVATAASFQFTDAANAFQGARDALVGTPGRDAERAHAALDKLWKICARTRVELTVDPPDVVIPRVLRTVPDATRKQITTALQAIGKI